MSRSLADTDTTLLQLKKSPDRNPIMRHPTTFTAKVPNGKSITLYDCTIFDTQYRMPPPKKLPMPTSNTSFIITFNCV